MTAYWSNGTEFADWQEVWCNRCAHDHEMHIDQGPGCHIVIRAFLDEPIPEIEPAGYAVLFSDGTGRGHEHEIPAVPNALPAAAFCTKFALCSVGCLRHPNGAIIAGHRRGDTWEGPGS